ncbi:hypothetical protein H7Y21_03430 [Arenimonas sp.]|nr:hypothetical protein [Candidatus Parcubacteria bacterium]
MQNTIKKIIIILTIIVLGVGIFFGVKFYQNSNPKNSRTPSNTVKNTDRGRTPFQTRVSTSTGVETIVEDTQPVINPESAAVLKKPRLVQLWKDPVSGFDFVYKDIEISATTTTISTSTIIKNIVNKNILKNQEYIYLWDRKTGHIYENLASTTEVSKISNYTLPGAEDVYFADNSSVVVRKLKDDNDTIDTFYIKLEKEFSTSTTYKANIRDINIDSSNIAFLGSVKKVFYFINKTGKGIITSIDGSTRTSAISTSVSEWLSQYVNKDLITLTTKPSAYFKGYLFTLSTNGLGKNIYILGEKYGFNTLTSPDGKKVIYNEILNNTLETFIYDIKSKSSTYLSQATLIDKCVWTLDSKKVYCGIPQKLYEAPYPDAWYKNDVSFADNIWSINAESGKFSITIPLQDQVSTPIDVYKMVVSSSGKYLLFQNKNDLTLWKYNLTLE